jgi:hypothetical protein
MAAVPKATTMAVIPAINAPLKLCVSNRLTAKPTPKVMIAKKIQGLSIEARKS